MTYERDACGETTCGSKSPTLILIGFSWEQELSSILLSSSSLLDSARVRSVLNLAWRVYISLVQDFDEFDTRLIRCSLRQVNVPNQKYSVQIWYLFSNCAKIIQGIFHWVEEYGLWLLLFCPGSDVNMCVPPLKKS
ncbi:hypothetical protein AVEN_25380-1 [Araneus ventricosus]|uniref:Uncharacterized protein n=1 Tax=Araneus ventricosus TaxID=182803 RepID=A0A4Y2EG38_ARAVE|nr:hypothetical protein AVEN_25380-1 [Araneus ventricosus]